jgi:hypothetical protein
MHIAPATSNAAKEPSQALRLVSPRLLRLGREQHGEAVELLAQLLLDAAQQDARGAVAERDHDSGAPVDVSAATPKEGDERVWRPA